MLVLRGFTTSVECGVSQSIGQLRCLTHQGCQEVYSTTLFPALKPPKSMMDVSLFGPEFTLLSLQKRGVLTKCLCTKCPSAARVVSGSELFMTLLCVPLGFVLFLWHGQAIQVQLGQVNQNI